MSIFTWFICHLHAICTSFTLIDNFWLALIVLASQTTTCYTITHQLKLLIQKPNYWTQSHIRTCLVQTQKLKTALLRLNSSFYLFIWSTSFSLRIQANAGCHFLARDWQSGHQQDHKGSAITHCSWYVTEVRGSHTPMYQKRTYRWTLWAPPMRQH